MNEIAYLNKSINTKYQHLVGCKMSYDLDGLWNKESVVAFQHIGLRRPESLEEVAVFLIRWATELFSDWATWMLHMLPGCTVS